MWKYYTNLIRQYFSKNMLQKYTSHSALFLEHLRRHQLFIRLFKQFCSAKITDYPDGINPTLITRKLLALINLFWLLKRINTRKTRVYDITKTIILLNKFIITWATKQYWTSHDTFLKSILKKQHIFSVPWIKL